MPDVVVVGAGVVGASVAFALQARGARVVVLERAGVAEGQSGVQPGGVRLQWGTPVACGLALESLAWWRGAQDRLDPLIPLSFSSCGYLFLAHSQGVLARLTANVRVQNEAGVPSRIVAPSEAAALVPGLETSSLVISAERRFAAKQLHDGRVLASDLGAAGDPEKGAPAWRRNVREVIRDLLPILEYADLDVIASGVYDVTPDRQPILGPLPGLDGLHVAAGFSGHGFMIAPAVGRILADAVVGVHDPVLDILDWGRFAAGRTVPEPQVI